MSPIVDVGALGPLLVGFSTGARERLEAVLDMDSFDGSIGASEVQDVLELEGKDSVEELMVELLPLARLYSVPSTSEFPVGAVARGVSGALYFGANLELPSEVLGLTVHAEQSTVANAHAHGESGILSLAVTAAPCGHCRQFLNELSTSSQLRVIIPDRAAETLQGLLPAAFGPADLGIEAALLSQETVRLSAPSDDDPLVEAAVAAARRSYAPYTAAYSGVALQLRSGGIVAASYLENAAYNPSLPPAVAALERLRFVSQSAIDVTRAVLAEVEDARISQRRLTAVVLEAVAPEAELGVVEVVLEP